MKTSIARVRKSLPEAKRSAFDTALTTVAASQFDFGKIMSGSVGASSIEASVKQTLQGKSGEEVIAYAEQIQKERQEKERTQALSEIKELEAKQAKAAQARQHLAAFEVLRSRFYKTKRSYLSDQPIIELTVKNGTTQAVSRAYFKGTLASPGRAVPWVRDDFNYEISGGLEPGESATWHLSPNMFGEWGRVEAHADAVFTVEVVKLDGADKKPLYDGEALSERELTRLSELKAKFKP
jgi:hypothetical protein